MEAHWSRVRHVEVPNGGRQKRSLLLYLSAVLLVPAVVMLLGAGCHTTLLQDTYAKAGVRATYSRANMPVHPALKAAEDEGIVQAIRTKSKLTVASNVLTHALAADPERPPATPAREAGKLVSGRSSEEIRAAATKAVATHMLQETNTTAEQAAPAAAATTDFAKKPNHVVADATNAEIQAVAQKFSATKLMVNAPDENQDRVLVKMYMESECPACRLFSTTYLKDIVDAPGMSDIMDLEMVPFGNGHVVRALTPKEQEDWTLHNIETTANILNTTKKLLLVLDQMSEAWTPPPELKFFCQHGETECEGNGWETCIQDVAPKMADWFPVIDCIESRGCPENMEPPKCVGKPGDVAQQCVQEFGKRLPVQRLLACYRGVRGKELMLMNDIATLDANIAWAPWLTVDGSDVVLDPENTNSSEAFHEQFLLGKKICDAYVAKSGKEPPAACATFPQTLADVPSKPFDKYPKTNFTNLIAEQKEHAKLKEEEHTQFLQEQANASHVSMYKMIGAAVLVLLVAGGAGYYCIKRNKEEHLQDSETKPA